MLLVVVEHAGEVPMVQVLAEEVPMVLALRVLLMVLVLLVLPMVLVLLACR